MNKIPSEFAPEEKLLRAVWPPAQRPSYWRGGRLSSAAFKDKRGLSVSRTYDRATAQAVAEMRERFQGAIVSVRTEDCQEVQAVVCYLPSKSDPYHSEIHGSASEKLLNDAQALYLARMAKLEYRPAGSTVG